MVRPFALATGALAAALLVRPARGHVQPSVDANNRYLKLSPMGDRVRLAYTVLFGERPGAALRRRLDRDRDGQVSAAEADALGKDLGAALRPAVEIAIDGAPVAWQWARIDVGLGSSATSAGALSVDLIAWLCTPGGAEHTLALRDEYVVDAAGDTELKLEDGPGVTLGARLLGGDPMPSADASWTGPGGPITRGLELHYRVDDGALRPKDGRCAAARPPRSPARWPYLAAAAVLLAAAALLARRRRPEPRR